MDLHKFQPYWHELKFRERYEAITEQIKNNMKITEVEIDYLQKLSQVLCEMPETLRVEQSMNISSNITGEKVMFIPSDIDRFNARNIKTETRIINRI